MDFAEKKRAYDRLQGENHLCCDHEHLTKLDPNNAALKSGMIDREKSQREILWALLDVATVEEIETYRNPAKKSNETIEKLVSIITAPAPETMEELKNTDDEVCGLIDSLEADGIELTDDQKDLVSAYKGLLSAAMIELRKKAVEAELIGMDLESATQPKLASIARLLDLKPENFRKETLVPFLDAYRLAITRKAEAEKELPSTDSSSGSDEKTEAENKLPSTASRSGNDEETEAPVAELCPESVEGLAEAKKKAEPDPE